MVVEDIYYQLRLGTRFHKNTTNPVQISSRESCQSDKMAVVQRTDAHQSMSAIFTTNQNTL